MQAITTHTDTPNVVPPRAAHPRAAQPCADPAALLLRRRAARRLVSTRIQPLRGPGFTLMIALMAAAGGLLGAWLAGHLPYGLYMPVQVMVMFLIIEMGHEAVHGAVHPNRHINNAVGHTSSLLFGSSYRMHQRGHRSHHGRPETAEDAEQGVLPDARRGSLRWMAQLVFLAFFFLVVLRLRALRDHPDERPALLLSTGLALAAFLWTPKAFFLGWYLPAHVAMALFWLIAFELSHDLFRLSRDGSTRGLPAIIVHMVTFFHEEHHLRPGYPFFQWPALYFERVRTMRALSPEDRAFVTRELGLLPLDAP